MKRQTSQTEFTLSQVMRLNEWAHISAAVQERADGSGYRRRVFLSDLSANILADANLCDVLANDPPTQKALSKATFSKEMERLGKDKKLSAIAVASVLRAAGHSVKYASNTYPNGLTRREAQVLARLGRSETTAQIAEAP